MKRKLACLAILGLVGILPSCVTEFEHPLVDPATAVMDQALIGDWTAKDPSGNIQHLFVGAEPDRPVDPNREAVEPGLARFTLLSRSADNKLHDPLTMRFITTKVGDFMYANIVLPPIGQDVTKETKYWLYRYRVVGDKLELWHSSFEEWAKAIESGMIRGNVVREQKNIKTITVTDSAENVAKFLKNGGDALVFLDKHKAEYQRVK